jgi:hypothetical protein
MHPQPSRRQAKVMSEFKNMMSIALTTRLQPTKANSEWTSQATRDGCTEQATESMHILNQKKSTWKISGKS